MTAARGLGILRVQRRSRQRCETSPSSSLCSMPPLLVGEALAYRRVFVGQRFAPVCPAAGIGFGAPAIIAKNKSSAKGSPTRGAVAAAPATERFSKAKMTERFRNAAGFCAAPLKYQAPAPLSRLPAATLFHIFFTRSAIPFHNYRIQ